MRLIITHCDEIQPALRTQEIESPKDMYVKITNLKTILKILMEITQISHKCHVSHLQGSMHQKHSRAVR